MFTDVVSSTRLWEHHDEQMDAALVLHDEILRSAIEREQGYVFTTAGDEFAAAFATAAAARRAALSIQDQLANQEWPTPEPIRVRIGLHVGEAHERDGDYFGPTLNRAARIMSAAHGGQVIASAAFAALVGTDRMIDLGEHRLKDLGTAEHLWQVNPGTFPALRTLDVALHNLPVERTPLIGRDDEISGLVELVDQHRLVTILGIGGTGKTRVAVATAAELTDRFPDGVWFVDLVPTDDADDVAQAIAEAAGLQLAGTSVIDALVDALARRRALFVVDNCEHVTDDVAEVLEVLLDGTTEPRFLATSREPLEVVGERRVALEPLDVSSHATSPAVQLFEQAAARVGAHLSGPDIDIVVDVCEHLDGHPLSIELAAAQLAQLTIEQLREHLDRRFELLARGRRRNRHATLLGVLDDAWEMLDDRSRRLLVQLAAFPSRFALDDIEGVCATLDVGAVTRTLANLVDHSLVASDGQGRFRLLETIKLFASQRDVDQAALERHTTWILEQLASHSTVERHTSLEFAAWIDDHYDDWRAVEDRLADAGAWAELAEMMRNSQVYFAFAPGTRAMAHLLRVERYLSVVDASEPLTIGRLHLAAAASGLPARRPDWMDRGSRVAIEHLAHDDPADLASAKIINAWIPALQEPDRALGLLDDAITIAEQADAREIANVALSYQGIALALAGRYEEARAVADELVRRRDIDAYDYGRALLESLLAGVYLLTEPALAFAVLESSESPLGSHPTHLTLKAAAAAGAGKIEAARGYATEARTLIRQWSADDGFPDLLIPPAALAFAVGDHARCRALLTAVRHHPAPTQNFSHTIIYRQLRDAVGLDADDPLDDRSIEDIYDEATAWMSSLDDADI